MTVKGIMEIMQALKANYPNYNPNIEQITRLWMEVFNGFDDSTIKQAVNAYVLSDTKGFAPAVGQVMEYVKKPGMSEIEAWGYVRRALRNSSYGAEEEFSKLPESVKQVVRSPAQLKEWALLDESEVQTVIASNFMRSFRATENKKPVMQIQGKPNPLIDMPLQS